MRITLFLLLLSLQTFACELSNGKLSFLKLGDAYKIYLSQQPQNTCFTYDSITLTVSLRCKNGLIETTNIGLHDTLTYTVDGMIVLRGSIRWYFNGNYVMRSFSPQCFGLGSGCFEKVPELSNPLPPYIFIPELSIANGLITSNVGGTLVIVNLANSQPFAFQFNNAFEYQLASGQWYIFLLLANGTTIGEQLIEIP